MRTIPVKTASANYDVILGSGLLSKLKARLDRTFGKAGRTYFVVSSPEIWALWSERFLHSFGEARPTVLFLPSGERFKRLATVERLATELSEAGADRASVLLAFGGGVVGDVTGMLAAIYMRGIEYVQIPTTLLAQVDSSVGGKTGVNLTTGKNLLGAFYHPKLVLVDPETLATLPLSEFRAGLFESIKAGFIRDRKLFRLMEEQRELILRRDTSLLETIIATSIRMKAEVVGEDERESGLRMILNFGHTVGHAIEAVAGYGKLLHGDAVGLGMLAALDISHARGLPGQDFQRGLDIVRAYGLPVLPKMSVAKLMERTASDKKNIGGKRHFVLLQKLGTAYVAADVTEAEIKAGIATMLSLARP